MTRSVEIPNTAVEAAERAYETFGAGMRDALAAALPYLMPEVVVDHRAGETCSVVAEVDPDTGFARLPGGNALFSTSTEGEPQP